MNWTRRPLVCLLAVASCTTSSATDEDAEAWATAAEACARLSACFDFEGIRGGFDSCLRVISQRSQSGAGTAGLGGLAGLAVAGDPRDPAFECATSAVDCEAAGRCINGGVPASECEGSVCDGSIVRSCASGVSVAYDCALRGEECLTIDDFAVCGRPAMCEEPTGECRDGVPVQCFRDVETISQCDLDCLVVDESARSICADTSGPACEPGLASSRCDGNVAVTCPFGFETRRDCGLGECAMTSDGALCRSEPACRGTTCDGDMLVGCLPGARVASVDCTRVGARTCEASAGGARCVR